MQADLLRGLIEDIAGKQATEIVTILIGKKDVNEFIIAKKLKMTINQTRNFLYKLSDKGLVSFTRKKDKRKGWYIYFWTLDSLRSLEMLENRLENELKQLEAQANNRHTKRFYFCEICNVEVAEETALLNNFVCQECGQVYKLSEQSQILKELEGRLNKIKKQISIVREEKLALIEKEGKKKKSVKKPKKSKKPKKPKKAKKAKQKATKKKKPAKKLPAKKKAKKKR